MEELALRGNCLIIWNSVDVTKDVMRYLSSLTYVDHEEGAADNISLVLDNQEGLWSGSWHPKADDVLEVKIGYQDELINCGLFQVDEIVYSGMPHQVEIKAISTYRSKQYRTRNSKAFEKQTLRSIASFFCSKHGLTLIDKSSKLSAINLDRKTQDNETDLMFLSKLATEYGFLFSIKGGKMIFTSYYDLDKANSVCEYNVFQIGNYSITEKTYDTYAGAVFKARNTKGAKVVEQKVDWAPGWDESTAADDLIIEGTAENDQQAQQKAIAGLWKKNKLKQAGRINDLPGNPILMAGQNFDLTGLGLLSCKSHVMTSTHQISGNGAYTTSLDFRKCGTVPRPKYLPPTKTDLPTSDVTKNDYFNTK